MPNLDYLWKINCVQMKNLRLYNTDNQYVNDELAGNNTDVSGMTTVVPGVSLLKDRREMRYNPKDREVLYATITELHRLSGSTTAVTGNSNVEIKYFSGTTQEVLLTSNQKLEKYVCVTPFIKAVLPTNVMSSVTFEYVVREEAFIKCRYQIETGGRTKILNSSGYYGRIPATYMLVDGVEVAVASAVTFSTTGVHEVKFLFSGNSIGSVFSGITNLLSVEIPDYVTASTAETSFSFTGCTGLKSVKLPKNLTYLPAKCFAGCSSLERIVLPETLLSIGANCFSACTSLVEITSNAIVQPVTDSSAFINIDTTGNRGKLYYPTGSDYSTWLSNTPYFLGYYSWTGEEI